MRFLAFLVLATVGFNGAHADALKAEAEIRPFIDSVMERVGSGDLSAAFALMKPYTIVPSSEFEAMASNSKAQREMVGSRLGAAAGYEFVDQAKVGKQIAGDIISDKKTFLLIKAMERAQETDAEVLRYWIGKRPKDPTEKVRAVKAIFEKLEVDVALKEKVMEYHDRALGELDAIPVEKERKQALYDFAESLIGRQH